MKSFKEILGIQEEEKPIPINASESIALKEQIEEEETVASPSIGTDNSVMTQEGMMTPGMMTRKQRRYLFKLLGIRDKVLTKTELDRRVAAAPAELKRRRKHRKKMGLKIKRLNH